MNAQAPIRERAKPTMPIPTFVEIAVNLPGVVGLFHYHIPPELEGRVCLGSLVVVPFGKQKTQGVVLRLIESPDVPTTRPVLDLVDPQPVLTPTQIDLARWMCANTLSPLAACIEGMLPPGLSRHADTLYRLIPDQLDPAADFPTGTLATRLVHLLQKRGELRGQQIDRALGHPPRAGWRNAMLGLTRRGIVLAHSILPPPGVQPKLARTVQLAVTPQAAHERLPFLGRSGTAAFTRRQAVLGFLIREPWPVDVSWVYAQSGGKLSDLQYLAEEGLVALGETETWRDPLSSYDPLPYSSPPLTGDQQQAWGTIEEGITAAARGEPVLPYLLHGVTGSGKTEIYLQAVARTLRLGRQAIVLVPEIALTPQTVRRFAGRFPGQVGLVHSRLSAGERYDTWRRARAGLLPVVIGPRSALLQAPLARLGLIVVDECHDDSYYQGESAPFYHAASLAVAYARLSRSVCLLGSATPDVTMLHQAQAQGWNQVRLPGRILAHRAAITHQTESLGVSPPEAPSLEGEAASLPLPPVHVVDMRQELKAGNRSIFSRDLQHSLGKVLSAGQQAILFLNRRGAATFVFCRECGFSFRCPNCAIPLTYHAEEAGLVCHYCNYRRKLPARCPQCHSSSLRHYGAGTEKVESELLALYPQARTLRWDASTTQQKGAHEIILAHFAARRADVLVGTQMLAKGLDLPLVTLVGVVLADVGLNLPDYRSAERVFQVLTQVAGRAGRSLLGGEVILQTFQPEHYAIQAAAQHDYNAFYQQEQTYRKELRYPPFSRLARLEFRERQAARAEQSAVQTAALLRHWIEQGDFRATDLIGPVPCFFDPLQGYHRWQVIVRGPDPLALLRGRPLPDCRIEIDPVSLL